MEEFKEGSWRTKFFVGALIVFVAGLIVFLLFQPQILPAPEEGFPTIHQFFGSVSFSNSSPMPDGTQIYAVIGEEVVENSTTSGGVYGSLPFFILENFVEGDTTSFYINYSGEDLKVAEYVLENFALTELNLVFSEFEEEDDDEDDDSGDNNNPSGGPGGPSSNPSNDVTPDINSDEPDEKIFEEQNDAEEKVPWSNLTKEEKKEVVEDGLDLTIYFLIGGIVLVLVAIIVIIILRRKGKI